MSTEAEITKEIEAIMIEVDRHELSSPRVERQETIDFLRGIIDACESRAETIESEMAESDE